MKNKFCRILEITEMKQNPIGKITDIYKAESTILVGKRMRKARCYYTKLPRMTMVTPPIIDKGSKERKWG